MSKFEVPTQYVMHRKCSQTIGIGFSHHYDYVDVCVGNEIG